MTSTHKNGEHSMTEILATIRKQAAERKLLGERDPIRRIAAEADQRASGEEAAWSTDLPSILRPGANLKAARGSLGNRLSDVLRVVTASEPDASVQQSHGNGSDEATALARPALAALTGGTAALTGAKSDDRTRNTIANDTLVGRLEEADKKAREASAAGAGVPQHASADPTATGQPKPKRQMASFLDTRMSRMGQMGQRSGETSITVNVTDATGVDEQLATTGASAPTSPMRASTAEPQSDALDPAPAIDTTVSDVADAPAPPVSAAAPLDGWTSHRRLVDADVVAPAEVATDSPRSALVPDGGQHSGQDGAAELLRPVLRQWLADNMPRIVERALHMELAAGVKPRGPKSDN